MPIKLWGALFAQELRKSRHDFESIINFVLKFSVSHWVPDVQSYIGKQKGLSTTGKLFLLCQVNQVWTIADKSRPIIIGLEQFEQFQTSLNEIFDKI